LTVKKNLHSVSSRLLSTPQDNDNASTRGEPWNPFLRRIMGSVATLGILETSLLTYYKFSGPSLDLCGTSGDCSSVWNGPYSVLPSTDIPLSALGFAAYAITALLALAPILTSNNSEDDNNRMALLSLTTAMATFSIFLLSLLYGVLHTSCPYCLASACFSILLAACAWFGGCLPEEDKQKGVQAAIATFVATTAMAVAFFVSVDPGATTTTMSVPASSGTLWTSTSKQQQQQEQPGSQNMVPPPITTTSSERALLLSDNLSKYNAKMYGAYWCGHCYDQKQAFGKVAFQKISYVECSTEGLSSQTPLCKERNVPGYPTWEIDGKLYPGERELDELEDILVEIYPNNE
jgi:uncharacterized membrane protein